MNINKDMIKSIRFTLAKNSPSILTGFGVTGLVTTTIMAVKATPKAMVIIEDARIDFEAEKGYTDGFEGKMAIEPVYFTLKDKFLLTWKVYLPAFAMGTITAACIVGANSIHSKRNEAIMGLYALSESALKEYKEKVVETIGESKEQKIQDEVAKEKLKKNPVNDNEVVLTGLGDTLCYDSLSGRYFKSDIEAIRKSVNKVSRDLLTENFVTLNDLYYELGLTNTKMGEMVGWHVDDGLVEADFSSQLTENGTPCLVMDFSVEPRYGYGTYSWKEPTQSDYENMKHARYLAELALKMK